MAVDNKYGKVTLERGNIGEDEPVVVFRAQDKLLHKVLTYYYQLCVQAGSPNRHLELINETHDKIKDWQYVNFTKTPSSDSYNKEN